MLCVVCAVWYGSVVYGRGVECGEVYGRKREGNGVGYDVKCGMVLRVNLSCRVL